MECGMTEPDNYFCQIPDLDWEYSIEAVGGSGELYDKILRQTVRRIPDSIQAMDMGLVPDGDFHVFALTAHGLKSSFRQIGHRRLASDCEAMETLAKAGDEPSCRTKYVELRNELKSFYELVSTLIRDTDEKQVTDSAASRKCLSDFKGVFERAKTASEEYDTLEASELLSPLSGYRFGEHADEALALALHVLDMFQPLAAIEHIEKLIVMCGDEAGVDRETD